MKTHKYLLILGILIVEILVLSTLGFTQVDNGSTNYAEKVNTLIGTKGKGEGSNILEAGFTFPGAAYPFGMVQFTPTFFDADKGFVVNQLSGAGCPHMGNFPTLPLAGELTLSPNDMKGYKPDYKVIKAMAGYYNVALVGHINCELSVTKRTGMARYSFPDDQKLATIIIGSGINATGITESNIKITGPNTCEGTADGGSFCGINTNYKIYFVAQFDAIPASSGTWEGDNLKAFAKDANGKNSGVYFTFNIAENKNIQYKFALSYVSIANAKENLETENAQWDFTRVKDNAIAAWNHLLNKIEVDGGSIDHTTQFYTHLYHSLIHPSISNDVNGEYPGSDFKIHIAKGYNNYTGLSNWDTYRTQIQLMSLLAPHEASDVITSTLNFADQSGGGFPRWVMANIETGIMQGDPTSIVVANAYAFGAKDFDTKNALIVMRRGAEVPGTKSQNEQTRPHLDQYLTKGFIQASMSLEYSSADFAIGEFALQSAGNKQLFQLYEKKAQSWKNLYNPETKWLQSRNPDGSWKKYDEDWREATYNNYFWMIPYDLKGLIDTIGGKKVAEARLDDFFRKLNAQYNDDWFAAGNEPDFQAPWIYNWAGAPYKTQVLVKRILHEQYTNRDNSLPGNDDLGAMGAWYVFANIGLYPMIPGIGGFAVNSPSFPIVKIHLSSGKILTIKGGDETKDYIQSMQLNGKVYNNTWLPLNDFNKGGIISFILSDQPNKQWGTTIAPPSFN
jgi:predicted alpha-1,2-mannosidase